MTGQGRERLMALKAAAGSSDASVIPVGESPRALLRPVATAPERLKAEDIRLLTQWRNRFVHAFLTEFEATEPRTAQWLTDVVGPSDRKILFMADDPSGRTFGYMGLDLIDWGRFCGEADAVVRGADAKPGTMALALTTLMRWAQEQLGLQELGVRVRSDNSAIEFYRKAGFRERRRVPLRRVEEPGMVRWVEDAGCQDATVQLVHMVWEPNIARHEPTHR